MTRQRVKFPWDSIGTTKHTSERGLLPNARWRWSGMCHQNVPFLLERGISNFCWIESAQAVTQIFLLTMKKKNTELYLSRILVTAINGVVPVLQCMLPSCIPTQKDINSCSSNVIDSRFWKAFVLPVHAKTIDLCLIQDRNQLLKTKLFRKTQWFISETVFMALRKGFILLLSFKIPYSRVCFKTIS